MSRFHIENTRATSQIFSQNQTTSPDRMREVNIDKGNHWFWVKCCRLTFVKRFNWIILKHHLSEKSWGNQKFGISFVWESLFDTVVNVNSIAVKFHAERCNNLDPVSISKWYRLNIRMLSYQYMYSHCIEKTGSYLYNDNVEMWPGGWINVKMSSYRYIKSHCGDKTILRPSCIHNGISYTGKMTSLYWIRALVPSLI